MQELVDLLIARHLTISSCESFTVGMFASQLGEVPGVSKTYKGSLVTYQNDTKATLLDIPLERIEQFGVVSRQIAYDMVAKCQKILGTDVCASFTGNAGPGVMEGKPKGLVYIGIAINEDIEVFELLIDGDREVVKNKAIYYAKEKIIEKIRNIE